MSVLAKYLLIDATDIGTSFIAARVKFPGNESSAEITLHR